MLILILIIVIIVLYARNSDLKREKENLEKIIEKLKKEKGTENQEELIENVKVSKIQAETNEVKNNTKDIEIKVEKTNEEIEEELQGQRNTAILVTGATLIVLAAIVFLTSTWSAIPNIVKTIVLVLLIGVFGGASKIAREKLNLEKTANTFYYIAISYIPIVFVSISIFKLFGEYLSIYGDGKFIYFSISSIIVASLYLFEAKRKQKQGLKIASLIIQEIAVICIASMFNLNILCALSAYNLILQFIKNDLVKQYASIAVNFIAIISIFAIWNFEITNILNIFLLTINYYLIMEKNKLYEIFYLTGIYLTALTITNLEILNLDYELQQIMILVVIIGEYIYGSFDIRIQKTNTILTFIAISMLYLTTTSTQFPSYIIMYTIPLLALVTYITREDFKNVMLHFIPIGIILSGLNTTFSLNLSFNINIYIGMLMLGITCIKKIENENIEHILDLFEIYGNMVIIFSFIISSAINFDETINNILVISIIMIEYIVKYIDTEDALYRIMAYIFGNVILLSIGNIVKVDEFIKYIVPITTLIIAFAEQYFEKLKDDANIKYLIISFIISFITLNIDLDILSFVSLIILIVAFLIYQIKNYLNEYLNIIPMLAIFPGIYAEEVFQIGEYNLSIFASIITVLITAIISIKKQNINMYTIASFLYLMTQIFIFDINKYFNISFVVLWSVGHLINQNNNIIKIVLYVTGLILYNNIIYDLDLEHITALNLLGYIAILIAISRTILKNTTGDFYKFVEVFGCIIIYTGAITEYSGEPDGMIFVMLLVLITIFSYIKKYGPIFLSSITAILVNVFILTRYFWFSIPWWVYMLVVGILLITFAMNNEAKEVKNKNKIAKVIKEYMDM